MSRSARSRRETRDDRDVTKKTRRNSSRLLALVARRSARLISLARPIRGCLEWIAVRACPAIGRVCARGASQHPAPHEDRAKDLRSSSDARPSGVPRVQRRSLDRRRARALVAAVPSFSPRVVRLLALVPSARSRARCSPSPPPPRRSPRPRPRASPARPARSPPASAPPQRAGRRPRRPRRVHPCRG